MAIISIPSSIGGVTIPGTSTNGPLGALFNDIFGTTNLQYPRDLQSLTRGHYIMFEIKDINPIGYDSSTNYSLGSGLLNGASNLGKNVLNSVENLFSSSSSGNGTTATDSTLTAQTYTTRGTISLYIPETMAFSYASQYNDISATSVGAQAIGAALNTVENLLPVSKGTFGKALNSAKDIVSGDAVKLGLKAAGLAVNPKLQLLYEGLGFREYQMAFTFTPYSQQEAKEVTTIINTFKKYAAPRLVDGSGGMFFIPPAVVQPTFYFNGQINKNVNAVTESVITNIQVNYSPNGWSTYNDGAPVQTTLTIDFKETKVLDRDTLVGGNY
jgi:hypothetical protein